ncbi:HemK2/MTQ2 family protein methyltransferase [Streptomyces sp. OR43]|uniref:HemK2/MTQ2 family protein methyltransferase n=1 Tax=Streptomyces sp. or43 TaxID=2478957 RepID=UPI0011CD9C6A|nr:HemK2/MTQ2 family protein methyltransferase [Streptomyces sp. or43]TXS38435.1 methyltransferase domain-containing protein [Streptomyces sp. or43]
MTAETAERDGAVLVVPPGVYAPQSDTRMLLRALERENVRPGAQVLDVCTGSGVLAVTAARSGARVTAVDVSRRSVATARLNALLNRRRVRVRRCDLAAAMEERAWDLVLCNPPYVPAPEAGVPDRGARRAWDAGLDGRAVLDRVCDNAPAALKPRGVLLMVHSGLCDPDLTVSRLERAGLDAAVAARTRVPLGPVLLSRRAWLSERALVDPYDVSEELVVVRAQRT